MVLDRHYVLYKQSSDKSDICYFEATAMTIVLQEFQLASFYIHFLNSYNKTEDDQIQSSQWDLKSQNRPRFLEWT